MVELPSAVRAKRCGQGRELRVDTPHRARGVFGPRVVMRRIIRSRCMYPGSRAIAPSSARESDMANATVNNGVKCGRVARSPRSAEAAPRPARFKWKASCKMAERHAQPDQDQEFRGSAGPVAQDGNVFSAIIRRSRLRGPGVTPVEYVPVGLASCLTAAWRRWRRTAASSCARSNPSRRLDGHTGHPGYRQRRA
jgi:hypothetical protein